ncbi:uncharacterized protein LOC112878070 [Panicum hallii]|nr:uncharacterized protein LOC112878070 [Panicum hallii]
MQKNKTHKPRNRPRRGYKYRKPLRPLSHFPHLPNLFLLLWTTQPERTNQARGEQPAKDTRSTANKGLLFLFFGVQQRGMVEKARTMARKLEIPQWKSGASDGLPSPTSPLDRASPRGWRHREAVGGVGLGILAALEAQPTAAAVPRVSAPVSIARRARLEVSELGCSGRCATSLCGGKSSSGSRPASPGAAFRVAEFLSCCDMCRRPLDGKDIFMYRGERAFCSMECRYHAIVSDEFQEEKERKRRAAAAAVPSAADGLPKKAATAEMSGSPCSGGGGQIFFTTGIVAA